VAVLQKLDVHTKKWTYIARKQNTSHEETAYLTKYHTTVQVMNRIQGTINKTQDTKHRKTNKTTEYTETTKHENKEKATARN
jgi:hypothetical protein